MACINTDSSEFQRLLEISGLPEFTVKAYCSHFLDNFNRFPHLDELPNANSENSLNKKFKIVKNSAKINTILEETKTLTIDEANIAMNDIYRDLVVKLTPMNKDAYVEIEHRPTKYGLMKAPIELDEKVNNSVIMTLLLTDLKKLFGINIIPITTYELTLGEFAEKVPEASLTNAFVYNGDIYVNTDVASVDAPVHELLHIFVGAIRFTDPLLYQKLLDLSLRFENYPDMIKEMAGRTRNDINEEILVLEAAKYLTGLPSEFDSLSEADKYEIEYNINRMLDSVLMGDVSIKSVNFNLIGSLTLKELASRVNSALCHNNFKGSMTDMHIHRIAMNTKMDLMKKGDLEEHCE